MDKKFKISLITISIVGILSIVALAIVTVVLLNNASIIEVMSRLG